MPPLIFFTLARPRSLADHTPPPPPPPPLPPQGSLTTGAVAGSADRGALAMTDRPFYAEKAHWSIRDSSGNWRVDEAASGTTIASTNTLHQIWIRQAPPTPELPPRSSYIADNDVSATMVTNGPPIVSSSTAATANGLLKSVSPITLDFPFYVFGADVFDRMAFTPEAYLAFAFDPAPGADSVTTNVTATPVGPSLHFGSADRYIKALTLNAPVLVFGLTAQTAVLVYDPYPTSSSGSFMKYEITFAKDGTSQYIEIRSGPTTAFGPALGTWMLTDGLKTPTAILPNNTLKFAAVKAGYSMVLQSDGKGMKWAAYPNTNLIRTFAPPPMCASAHARTRSRLPAHARTPAPLQAPLQALRAQPATGRASPAPRSLPCRRTMPPPSTASLFAPPAPPPPPPAVVLSSTKFGDVLDVTALPANVTDTTPPTIRLVGESPLMVVQYSPFNDPGITVTDNIDAKVINISLEGFKNVDTNVLTPPKKPIVLTYFATDAAGNVANKIRDVFVYDPCPAPERMCSGTRTCSILGGNCDPNASKLGSLFGGSQGTVAIVPEADTKAPVITVMGVGELFEVQDDIGDPVLTGMITNVTVGSVYIDAGAAPRPLSPPAQPLLPLPQRAAVPAPPPAAALGAGERRLCRSSFTVQAGPHAVAHQDNAANDPLRRRTPQAPWPWTTWTRT